MSKIKNWIIGFFLTLLIVIGIVYFFKNSGKQEEKKVEVVVPVKVQKVVLKELSKSLSAYGTVIPAPGAVDVISVAFESSINQVMVNDGQTIAKNDPLLVIQPSPNTYLTLAEIEASFQTAKQTLLHTKQLMKLQLATNDQVLTAQLAYKYAKFRLDNIKKERVWGPRNLLANVNGLVRLVNVKQGEIVPAGTPLVEIVAQNRFEIHLGIEADDVFKLKPGQDVVLASVYHLTHSKTMGHIRKLAYAVNPTSRLVDIFVTLPLESHFLLGELVYAEIIIKSEKGLVVPQSAILMDQGRYFLFTYSGGHAIRHNIELGIQNTTEVEVFSPSLHENDSVIILGNYELKDGMRVKIVND